MLEEKVEKLTTEIVALRKTLEEVLPGLASAGATEDAEDKPAAKKAPAKKAPAKKAPAKKKAVEPDHDADEVASIMRQAAKDVDKKAVQKYISEQECEDLAELLTKPELFDAAHAFAEGLIGGEEEEEAEDEEEDI